MGDSRQDPGLFTRLESLPFLGTVTGPARLPYLPNFLSLSAFMLLPWVLEFQGDVPLGSDFLLIQEY